MPRWLEGPIDEGSIDESGECTLKSPESDPGYEQYIFHDSVSRGERIVKQFRAGVVHVTTYSLKDK